MTPEAEAQSGSAETAAPAEHANWEFFSGELAPAKDLHGI